MHFPFTTQRRVEFNQTDAGGIMHFSVFFQMMEQAEHEFLRHLGLSVMSEHEGQPLSWPRVSATCDFRHPARFEDVLDIRIGVARIGQRSVTYQAEFRLAERSIASGRLVAACCTFIPGQKIQVMEIPPEIVARLEPYVLDTGTQT
jgi:4-hydroxybenzoyl-CoA thioesterase/acyl-CoA thioester hydrolase